MTEKLSFRKRLQLVQSELKAPKGQTNSFGKYRYRSNEDILEALKPLLNKYEIIIQQSDDIVQVGDRYYVRATARVWDATDTSDSITAQAYAREPESKKGMDESQITGAASSYARKYSLNGLFGIDDTKDADTQDNRQQQQKASHKPTAAIPAYVNRVNDIIKDFTTPQQFVEKLIELKKNKNFSKAAEGYYNEQMALFNQSMQAAREFEEDRNESLGH